MDGTDVSREELVELLGKVNALSAVDKFDALTAILTSMKGLLPEKERGSLEAYSTAMSIQASTSAVVERVGVKAFEDPKLNAFRKDRNAEWSRLLIHAKRQIAEVFATSVKATIVNSGKS